MPTPLTPTIMMTTGGACRSISSFCSAALSSFSNSLHTSEATCSPDTADRLMDDRTDSMILSLASKPMSLRISASCKSSSSISLIGWELENNDVNWPVKDFRVLLSTSKNRILFFESSAFTFCVVFCIKSCQEIRRGVALSLVSPATFRSGEISQLLNGPL